MLFRGITFLAEVDILPKPRVIVKTHFGIGPSAVFMRGRVALVCQNFLVSSPFLCGRTVRFILGNFPRTFPSPSSHRCNLPRIPIKSLPLCHFLVSLL